MDRRGTNFSDSSFVGAPPLAEDPQVNKRRLTIVTALLLLVSLTMEPGAHAWTCANSDVYLTDCQPINPRVKLSGGKVAVSAVIANKVPSVTATLRPAATSPIRVALISSGVDTSVLPSPFSNQVSSYGSSGDPVGFGTYAASIIFQLQGISQITSFGAYPQGVFDPGYLHWALQAIATSPPGSYDAVVVAVPPSEFLDPITAAMATGNWDDVQEAIGLAPLDGPSGSKVFGVPLDESLFNKQPNSPANQTGLSSFRIALSYWNNIQREIRSITAMHTPVVVPAGDLGSNPQTVLGIANFPEVVTVGGFNAPTSTGYAGNVSIHSSSGPSIDLRIKPDLLAPTGVTGLFPDGSQLAAYLRAQTPNPINNSLIPDWSPSGPSVVTPDKALLDTNLVSAAIVGMALGGIRAQGRALMPAVDLDLPHLKGALYAKSTSLSGVPVWKQGEGVLGGPSLTGIVPDLTFALTTPLVLSHADLGLESSSSPWSQSVPVAQGTWTPSVASTEVRDFVGVNFNATAKVASVTNSAAPAVTATYSALSGITLSAETGALTKEAGLYSGVITVPMTSATGSVVTQTVAFMLEHGFKPIARSFAIHDDSAGDTGHHETFSLSPTLPPGATVLDHPVGMLPINPMDTSFFFKVTDEAACTRYPTAATGTLTDSVCKGHAPFEIVPPGFYSVKEFSDYGAPYQYSVGVSTTATGWTTQTLSDDLGGKVAYTAFKTLLLPLALDPDASPENPRTCVKSYGAYDDWSGHNDGEPSFANLPTTWRECTERFLRASGVTPTVYDAATAGFFVRPTYSVPFPSVTRTTDDTTANVTQTVSPETASLLRINLGFIRKAVQTQVSSRYIDIVHPCTDIRFLSFRTASITTFYNLMHPTNTVQTDWQTGCDNLETLLATYNQSGAQSSGAIGLSSAHYAFNLPKPNYTAHMSLNFPYEVKNAFILVAVLVGNEVAVGLVTPSGIVQLPGASPNDPVYISQLQDNTGGWATGTANFEFNFEPKNRVSQGEIYLWFTPQQYWNTFGVQQAASWAMLKDNAETNDTFSFEMGTWTPVGWPAINFRKRGESKFTPCSMVTPTALPDQDCGHNFPVDSRYNHRLYDATSGNYEGGDTQISDPPECRQIEGADRRANVCEDWSLFVHSPRARSGQSDHTQASLMDLTEVTSNSTSTVYTSVMDQLKGTGAKLYVGAPVTNTGYFLTSFSSGLNEAISTSTALGSKFFTSNYFFEELPIPRSFVKNHSGALEFCINDSVPRWSTSTVGGQTVVSTSTYSSLCPGTKTSSSWNVSETTVPCLEKVPFRLNYPCETGDGYAPSTPQLGPYIRYPNRWYPMTS